MHTDKDYFYPFEAPEPMHKTEQEHCAIMCARYDNCPKAPDYHHFCDEYIDYDEYEDYQEEEADEDYQEEEADEA